MCARVPPSVESKSLMLMLGHRWSFPRLAQKAKTVEDGMHATSWCPRGSIPRNSNASRRPSMDLSLSRSALTRYPFKTLGGGFRARQQECEQVRGGGGLHSLNHPVFAARGSQTPSGRGSILRAASGGCLLWGSSVRSRILFLETPRSTFKCSLTLGYRARNDAISSLFMIMFIHFPSPDSRRSRAPMRCEKKWRCSSELERRHRGETGPRKTKEALPFSFLPLPLPPLTWT